MTRPGGSVAGPVQFALADVATYALILAARCDAAAVTVDLTINFLRPAMTLPLVAVATALRAGRRLFTAEVRITEEATGRLISQATTTYALSSGERAGGSRARMAAARLPAPGSGEILRSRCSLPRETRGTAAMTDLPSHVEIHEEGPREGFQIEPGPIPTSEKIRLIEALAETGLHHIQACSFVNTRLVPGWADAEAVVEGFTAKPGVHYTGLFFNGNGLDRALAFKRQADDQRVDFADRVGRFHAQEPEPQSGRKHRGDEET